MISLLPQKGSQRLIWQDRSAATEGQSGTELQLCAGTSAWHMQLTALRSCHEWQNYVEGDRRNAHKLEKLSPLW
jgi:hypothetical protein